MLDPEPVLDSAFDVDAPVALRFDHRGDASGTDHVGRMGQASQIELLKVHESPRRHLYLCPGAATCQGDVSCDLAQQNPLPPASGAGARRHLPLLLLLFAGSGCSALIYEIVWYQLLQLVIGSSAVSLGVLLATFMGGLCLGSLLLPRLKLGGQHPLRVYGK